MTFGNRILKLREEQGLSQKELGLLVNTGKDMISRYERGLITPSLDVASKIAQVLKVSLDFLVFGISEQTANQNVELKVQDVASLSDEDKAHVFAVIDAFVTKAKLQKILQ